MNLSKILYELLNSIIVQKYLRCQGKFSQKVGLKLTSKFDALIQ
jgi:hypothetical protein